MEREIFVVFIINNRYTRWESFSDTTLIVDLFDLLKHKYKIEKCIMDIKDIFFSKKSRGKLTDICPLGGSIYITTKEKFNLDKNIFLKL